MRRRGIVAGLLGLALLALPATADAAPQVTVSATTDLVHGQPIVVRGQGWATPAGVWAYICAVGEDVCEAAGYGGVGAAGRFTVRAVADVIVDPESWFEQRLVDCRVEACELRMRDDRGREQEVRQAITFDPSGPDPTRRTMTVAPTEDLVDQQLIAVAADGMDPGSYWFPGFLGVTLCRLPVGGPDDCDRLSRRHFRVGEDGHAEGQYAVDPILHLPGGDHDCRTGGCAVLGQYTVVEGEALSESALVPVTFDPDAPLRQPAAATVTPSTGLVDDQRVRVDATGFDPGEQVSFYQCLGPVTGTGYPGRCHLWVGRWADADENGEVHRNFGVVTRMTGFARRPVDCRRRPCVLVLLQTSPYRRVVTRLRFDPAVPPLRPSITVTPSANLDGTQTVTVHGSQFRANSFVFMDQCTRGQPWYLQACDRRGPVRVNTGSPDGGAPGVEWEHTMVVRRRLVPYPEDGDPVDCAVRRCVVGVDTNEIDSTSFPTVDLHFRR